VGLTAATSLDTKDGPPRLREALIVDSTATIGGAILGTSNITVYVESGVGISEGGRTGLTAVVCGIGLLLCLPLASLIQYIPVVATSGALVFVAISLCPKVQELYAMDWFEVVALIAMQVAVVLTFALDRAFLVGAVCYLLRGLWRRESLNSYLLASALILTLGLAFQ
jgi:AGZA family xanthine/uracil permease-like MFS transporter